MDDDVSDALQEAHTLLSDVRSFNDASVSDQTAVNRLYYACFHATRAVLYDRGIAPKTHEGMKSLIGKELVLTGEISRADGEFFGDMCDHRDRADYEYHPVQADVDMLLNRTGEFVKTMETLVNESASDEDEEAATDDV